VYEPSTASRSRSAPGSNTSGDTSSFLESGWNSEGAPFSQPFQRAAFPKRQSPSLTRSLHPSRESQSHTPESSSTSTSCPELLAPVNLAVSKRQRLDRIWSQNASDFGDGSDFVTPLEDLYSQKSIGELCLALPSNIQIQR
jgi:hypothetical protein